MRIIDLLCRSGLSVSLSQARRLVTMGAVEVDGKAVNLSGAKSPGASREP